MSRKNKSILIIVFVALIAILGSCFTTYAFLNPKRVTVYTFKDNYSAGETLTKDMLKSVQIDAKVIVNGENTDTSKILITSEKINEVLKEGDCLRSDVTQGTLLTSAVLATNGGTTVEENLSADMIGVTVSASNITGVTGEMKNGTVVNVYTTTDDGTTELLLEGIRVIGVETNDDGDELKGVTLEVSKADSLKLVNAANFNSIYLGIINEANYTYSTSDAVSKDASTNAAVENTENTDAKKATTESKK